MMELKKQVEAILFASGQRMTLDEISRLVRKRNHEPVIEALKEIEADYSSRDSSVYLDTDGTTWKLTIRNNFIPVVEKVVSDIELNKSVIETLAVIAWHYPILQSDVISIRTNKAYDHLNYLEEQGFISREKFGRTNKIRLTDKFSQYFELPKGQEKEAFRAALPEGLKKKLEEREKKIIQNEHIIEEEVEKQEQEQQLAEAKKEIEAAVQQAANVEVHIIDNKGKENKLETYDSEKNSSGVQVYDEPKEPKAQIVDYSEDSSKGPEDSELQGSVGDMADNTEEEPKDENIKDSVLDEEKSPAEKDEASSVAGKDEDKKEEDIIESMFHPEERKGESSISAELEAIEKKEEDDERRKAEEEKKKLLTGGEEDILDTEDEDAAS